MNAPDKTVLPKAREKVGAAVAELRDAVRTLQGGGWAETSTDLDRLHRSLSVWTQPGGWFDALEKPPFEMSGVKGLDP